MFPFDVAHEPVHHPKKTAATGFFVRPSILIEIGVVVLAAVLGAYAGEVVRK